MIFIDMLCSQYDLNLRIISLFEVVGEVGTLLRTEISALDNNVVLAVYTLCICRNTRKDFQSFDFILQISFSFPFNSLRE